MAMRTKSLQEYQEKQLADPEVRAVYEALEDEYALAQAIIQARIKRGLTQEELAKRMGTTQSVIARLESGRTLPSSRTLLRVAEATGTHFRAQFVAD
jgi:ribosome-binding protein aMBF1 (putative translation factor)